MRRAITSTLLRSPTRGSSTANSSPLSRETMSVARRQLWMRRAVPAQDLVADPVTNRVVDRLEVVEVEEQQGQIGAGVHVALQLQLEGAPVGHPGQGVDAGHPLDLGVAPGQLGPGSVEVDGHHHQGRGQDRGAGDDQARGCRPSGEGPVGEDGDHPEGHRREVAARAIATANRSAAAPTDGDAGVSEAGGCLDIE